MTSHERRQALSGAAVRPLPDLAGDLTDVDLSSLGWLDPLVDGARVVAIGESAHFNAESYRLRQVVLRYLVERHGFTVYAMESGFAEALSVDAWLSRAAGPGTEAEVGRILAQGLTSLMGMFSEQRATLTWLRSATAEGRRVRFYGVDTPGSNASLLPALDIVDAYLNACDPELRVPAELQRLATVGSASSAFAAQDTVAAYVALSVEQRDAITAGLSLLLARLEARRPLHRREPGATTVPDFEHARRALASAVALDAFRRDVRVNVRDLAQADTVDWLVRRGERVVLAAHNAHVQRWPTEFPGVLPPTTTAGQLLDLRLGERYRVIGVTNGSGETLTAGTGFFEGRFFDPLPDPPPGTLDAVMGASHDAPFGVDLHRLDDADRALLRSVREQRSGGFLCPIDALTAYDALVHLPRVTAARPDPAAIEAAPPEVAEAFRRWTGNRP